MSTYGVFYSKAAFDKAGIPAAPTTLDELTADLGKLKDAGIAAPLYVSGKDGWTLLQHRNAVNGALIGASPDVVSGLDHNEIKWSEVPGFMDQYTALAGWVKSGFVNADAVSATYDSALKAMGDGSAGMYFQGNWVMGDIASVAPDAEIGFFPLPPASGAIAMPMSPPSLIKVASFSPNKDAGLDLLNYFVEPEQIKMSLKASPGISAFTDVSLETPTYGLAQIEGYMGSAKVVTAFDDASTMAQPQDDLIAAYQQLLDGRLNAAGFATAVDAAWLTQGQKDGVSGF
jgi:raffinose/stachyose/melibiose transport system substrate-binding protein